MSLQVLRLVEITKIIRMGLEDQRSRAVPRVPWNTIHRSNKTNTRQKWPVGVVGVVRCWHSALGLSLVGVRVHQRVFWVGVWVQMLVGRRMSPEDFEVLMIPSVFPLMWRVKLWYLSCWVLKIKWFSLFFFGTWNNCWHRKFTCCVKSLRLSPYFF